MRGPVPNAKDADTAEFELPVIPFSLEVAQRISSLVRIDFGAATDVGKVRSNNEDAYIIYGPVATGRNS